jgi:hypothetical protein
LLSDVSCYNKFIFMEMENKNLKGAWMFWKEV